MAKKGGGNWIADAIQNPGALRRTLKAPEGKPIPAKKLDAAARGKYGEKTAKRARLAKTLKGLK